MYLSELFENFFQWHTFCLSWFPSRPLCNNNNNLKYLVFSYLPKSLEKKPLKEVLQPALIWDTHGDMFMSGKVRSCVVWIFPIHVSFRGPKGFSELHKSQQHFQEHFVHLKLSLDISTASVCNLETILITPRFWNVSVFKQEFAFSLNLSWVPHKDTLGAESLMLTMNSLKRRWMFTSQYSH